MKINPQKQFTKSQFTNFQLKNSQFFRFHPNENEDQMLGLHEWDLTYMITTVSSKKGTMRINMIHSI